MSTAAVGSTSQRAPTSLRELIERVPQVLGAQAPTALHLEQCASADAVETMARAEARLLKSAETFFEPLFRVSVLDNLGRKEDPFAEPGDEDFPSQAPIEELKTERRRVDAIADRAISEQPPLRASAEKVQQQAAHLQERMEKLALQAEAASSGGGGGGGGAGLLDTVYAGDGADGAAERARETDRLDDEALRRGAEVLALAEAKKAALVEEAAARRADLARQRREVDALEKEQAQALAEAAGPISNAGRRAEASREMESLAGVAGMSAAGLERCVREEEALVERNGGIRGWYEATVANVELLGGVRVSHRLLFGTGGGGGGVEGMELMVELGAGQIMEVTVSSVDGGLGSVQLCHAQSGAAGVSAPELEELRRTADALPAPQNLRMLVREALGRARCAAVVEEHVRLMRGRYVTAYTAPPREFTVTLNAGLVAGFRLHADYPKVAGGAELVSLVGIGGWNAKETEQMRRRVNDLALPTLNEAVDELEAAVEAFETGQP